MCRFAQDCLNAMNSLVKELEVQLGPDTGDLRLRTGLHSGTLDHMMCVVFACSTEL